jgi:hypothetical protein
MKWRSCVERISFDLAACALESGAGFAVGRLGGKFFRFALHLTCVRVASKSGERCETRQRPCFATRIRHEVRQNNWSEGRLRCRWARSQDARENSSAITDWRSLFPHCGILNS